MLVLSSGLDITKTAAAIGYGKLVLPFFDQTTFSKAVSRFDRRLLSVYSFSKCDFFSSDVASLQRNGSKVCPKILLAKRRFFSMIRRADTEASLLVRPEVLASAAMSAMFLTSSMAW